MARSTGSQGTRSTLAAGWAMNTSVAVVWDVPAIPADGCDAPDEDTRGCGKAVAIRLPQTGCATESHAQVQTGMYFRAVPSIAQYRKA